MLTKKLKILGYEYKIIYKDNDVDPILCKGQLCYGMCCPEEQTIYISLNQAGQQQFQTLFHEVLHCIDWHLSGNEGFTMDEKQIDLLATGLASIDWTRFVKKKNI